MQLALKYCSSNRATARSIPPEIVAPTSTMSEAKCTHAWRPWTIQKTSRDSAIARSSTARWASFSSFAAGFSYLSILTGLFQMFYLGFGAGGAAFIWSWPLVLTGQFLVALGFAELAAHYPLSGGAYQWSKLAGSPRLGFVVGWIYLACLVVTLAAVALALQALLPQISPAFQMVGDATDPRASAMNAVLLGCGLIVLTTVLNSVGVGILAKVNNVGVVAELLGAILLIALLWAFASRPPQEVLLATAGRGLGDFLAPLIASAGLTASYCMYGFDTAGSLAEETANPAPQRPPGHPAGAGRGRRPWVPPPARRADGRARSRRRRSSAASMAACLRS